MSSPAAAKGQHVTLDETSKRIIEQLQADGRRPYAAIGKAVGLSEAAVRQRVQRLLEAGVMQIVAVTDPVQVGFSRQAMVGLRVEGDVTAVAEQVAELREVDYVVVTAGLLRPAGRGRLRGRRAPARPGLAPAPGPAGVRTSETFVYLKLRKQRYDWGTR